MKKPVKILCLLAALVLAFGLGWRVMPKVWPQLKAAVAGTPAPAATPEPELYHPASNTEFGETVGANDSLIYYFYKDYCPHCKALEPLTAGLPGEITLPDGTVSKVRLVALNKVEDEPARIIADYYAAAQIPEERQYVPAIVIGEKYLFLGEEIIPGLMEALVNGEGRNTLLLNGTERTETP